MEAKIKEMPGLAGTAIRTTGAPAVTDIDDDGMEDGWEVASFGSIDAPNGGSLEDFDDDGVNNLIEYALAGGTAFGAATGDWFEYTYLRRQNAAALNLSYTAEQTGNLVSNGWSSAGLEETGAEAVDADFQSVTTRFPMAGTTNAFFRVKLEAR